MASVVGSSVAIAVWTATPSLSSTARSWTPKRSLDSRPRNATGAPSRAAARAVLNGPPPGCARSAPPPDGTRSISASPATTIGAESVICSSFSVAALDQPRHDDLRARADHRGLALELHDHALEVLR